MLSELVERLVDNTTGINGSADGFADLAKRIARTHGMKQHRVEALLSSTAFTCDCGRDDCSATIPEPGDGPDISIVVHV